MGKLERYPELFLVLSALDDSGTLVESTDLLDLRLSHLGLRCHLYRSSLHLLRHHHWILVGVGSARLHLLRLLGSLGRRLASIVLCLRHELWLLHHILALVRPSSVHRLLLLPKLAHLLVLLLLPGLSILAWSLIVLHIRLLIISN